MSDDLLTLEQAREELATVTIAMKGVGQDVRILAALRLEYLALRTAIAALEALEWRPIETAPKDGNPVLLRPKSQISSEPEIGRWFRPTYDRDHWKMQSGDGWYSDMVTHWMPLPSPPKE